MASGHDVDGEGMLLVVVATVELNLACLCRPETLAQRKFNKHLQNHQSVATTHFHPRPAPPVYQIGDTLYMFKCAGGICWLVYQRVPMR